MIEFNHTTRSYYSVMVVTSLFCVHDPLLRFWEKEFEEINPRKTDTGVRQYALKDIEVIAVVHSLVKEKGLTLEGARQTLRVKKDEETRRVELLKRLEEIRRELSELRDSFDKL